MGIHKKRVSTARTPRRGYTLVELVVAIGASSILMAGMGSAVFLSAEAFSTSETPTGRKVDAAQTQQQILNDLRYASSFSERTANAVTFTVPDRTGDGRPDTIRYAWSGAPGDPLTYELNGSSPVILAASVNQFDLSFLTQTLNAAVVPDDEGSTATLLFVSAGQVLEVERNLLDFFTGGRATSYVEPTESETKDITAFEAAGYSIRKIPDDAADADVQTALEEVDVIFISGDANDSALSDLYVTTPVGIVSGNRPTVRQFGFADNSNAVETNQGGIFDTEHFITSEFPLGPLTVTQSVAKLGFARPPYSPDLQCLFRVNVDGVARHSLLALNANARGYEEGTTVAGRRVLLPFGSDAFNPDTLTDEARKLMLRSIDWAAGNGPDGVPNIVEETKNFGFETIYADSQTGRRKQFATQVTLSDDGTLKSISVYVGGAVGPVRVGIYDNSPGGPGKLLAESELLNSSTQMAWLTFPVPSTDLQAGKYWLAVSMSQNKQAIVRGFGEGVYQVFGNDGVSDGMLADWGGSNSTPEAAIAIYGTYSPK